MTKRARSGRGWDAAPPRTPRRRRAQSGDAEAEPGGDIGAEADTSGRRGVRERAVPDVRDAGTEERPPRDQREWAREICLRQLAVRPRTRAELATAMTKRGIADDVVAEVLDRYDEVGIIDDAAFARAWVESRHHGKGLARRALGQELRRRGVDQEVVKEALAGLEPETEEITARELVTRKLRGMRGDREAIFRRLVGLLARKGYPPGIAIRAVKDVLAERSEEDEASTDDSATRTFRVNAEADWTEALEAEAVEVEWDRPDRV
jgi:regulatory protein